MIGLAISTGATQGLAFWAPAFYERHTNLSDEGGAGAAAGMILVGALIGTWIGASTVDRLRVRYEGAAMMFCGLSGIVGGGALWVSFLPVPIWFRLPVQVIGVAGVVAGLPGLAVMMAEVVPATLRGIAFSVTTFLATVVAAGSPPLVGAIADSMKITIDGELKGHLANAFLVVTPLVCLSGFVILWGRKFVAADIAAAEAAIAEAAGTSASAPAR
jgi:MFS family permease